MHTSPGGTRDQHEATFAAVHERLGQRPEGRVIHAAGPSSAGWVITAILESQEVWERFGDETLMPTLKSGGEGGFQTPPVERTVEVHNLLVWRLPRHRQSARFQQALAASRDEIAG